MICACTSAAGSGVRQIVNCKSEGAFVTGLRRYGGGAIWSQMFRWFSIEGVLGSGFSQLPADAVVAGEGLAGNGLRGITTAAGRRYHFFCGDAAATGGYMARKLASSLEPSRVRKDSGWNCTPWSGQVWWRMPMISCSWVQAVTTKSAGRVPGRMTRLW